MKFNLALNRFEVMPPLQLSARTLS